MFNVNGVIWLDCKVFIINILRKNLKKNIFICYSIIKEFGVDILKLFYIFVVVVVVVVVSFLIVVEIFLDYLFFIKVKKKIYI